MIENTTETIPTRSSSRHLLSLLNELDAFPLNRSLQSKKINRYIYDSGLAQKQKFQSHEREGISLLHRNSFIDEVSGDVESRGNDVARAFLMLDLANFRDADKAGAGDYMLVSVGSALQDSVETLNAQLKARGVRLHVGRYGGDEFVVGVVGNYHPGDLQLIRHTLIDPISQLDGYYKVGDYQAEKRKIRIKGDNFETIEVNRADPFERELFDFYFENGIILDNSQIQKEKKKHGSLVNFQTYVKQSILTIYPPSIHTVAQKLNFILARNPELGDMYGMIKHFPNQEQFQPAFLAFIEKVVFDRLLGAKVISFSQLRREIDLKKAAYPEMWIIDGKLIKEINDERGYAEADSYIRRIWLQISDAVKGEEDKIIFARRGGTFALAIKADQSLSQKAIDKLSSLRVVPYPDQKFSLPVGNAHVKGKITKDIFGALELEAEKDFYRQVLESIRPLHIDVAIPKYGSASYGKMEQLSPIGLITKALTGKRAYERLSRILFELQMMDTLLAQPEFENIRIRLIHNSTAETIAIYGEADKAHERIY